ncbi:MAG: hypothetical protein R2705_00965 [Ilumatobacteraceae bacterium]
MTTAPAGSAVVLTHPANWGDYKLDLLRDAARVAGCGEVTLISEPAAAAVHFAAGRLAVGERSRPTTSAAAPSTLRSSS